ncbi:hypothetical protein PG990_008325 [Apiospora arundinis]
MDDDVTLNGTDQPVGGYDSFLSTMAGAGTEEQGRRHSTTDASATVPEMETQSSHWTSSYHQPQVFPPSARRSAASAFPVYPSLPRTAPGVAESHDASHPIIATGPASGETKSNHPDFADMTHDAAKSLEDESGLKPVEDDPRHSSMDDGQKSGRAHMTPPRSRRTKHHKYDESDEDDVFELLEEAPSPTVTANATASTVATSTTSTTQAGDAAGPSSLSNAKDSAPQAETKCHLSKGNPPLSTDKVVCVEKKQEVAPKKRIPIPYRCRGAPRECFLPPFYPRSSDAAAAISILAPPAPVSSADPLSHADRQQQKCTDGVTAAPLATTSTEDSSTDDSDGRKRDMLTDKKKGKFSPPPLLIDEVVPKTGISPSTLSASITEPRDVKYPTTEEETDRYLRSLSINDLITLSTKAQCEMQERGRSFSSILTGGGGRRRRGTAAAVAPSAGAGGNGTSTATVIQEEVVGSGSSSDGCVGLGIGLDIGSGRLNKEKRKHDDTDPDSGSEEHAGANTETTTTTTSKSHQGEQKKSKKPKNEEGTVSPSIPINEPVGVIATQDVPIKKRWNEDIDLARRQIELDEEILKEKDKTNDTGVPWPWSSLKPLGVAGKTDPESATITTATATATVTAGVHVDAAKESLIKKALREKAQGMDLHDAKEECWESPDLCCGGAFVIIDRKDCSE